jgi:peptidoglycan/xylan/chitin deacetylase (PgdA/CDA1 family)
VALFVYNNRVGNYLLLTTLWYLFSEQKYWLGLAALVLGAGGLVTVSYLTFGRGEPAPVAASESLSFITATPLPGIFPSPIPSSSPATAIPVPTPTPVPYFAAANEMGRVMALEYHRIGYPEQRYQRTPDNLRADLQKLYERGYYPVNFIEIARGLPNVPPGKKPVALTFDDSDSSQFWVLENGFIDANSAVGILLNFHYQYPHDWPPRATFFVLGNDANDYFAIFGQQKWAKAKLQTLVKLGMEVGSHSVTHTDLSAATSERIAWELAVSQHVIEESVPSYEVQSLSVPFGGFPYTRDLLKTGQWGDWSYTYAANAAAWGGPGPSPFDTHFEPYHISRLEVTDTSLDYWLAHFDQNPHEYYISDGDPNRLTFPLPETALAQE